MTERPILFSGAMVRAILAGQKTQTRRVLKLPTGPAFEGADIAKAWSDNTSRFGACLKVPCAEETVQRVFCPHGEPGDRLWVREEHYRFGHWESVPTRRTRKGRQKWRFVAHEDAGVIFEPPPAGFRKGRHHKDPSTPAWHKRLARFMPRALARITLEVVEVRVQRLQEISEEDALAEGVGESAFVHEGNPEVWAKHAHERYRLLFQGLWEKINGERPGCSWEANPWCWVVSFMVVR